MNGPRRLVLGVLVGSLLLGFVAGLIRLRHQAAPLCPEGQGEAVQLCWIEAWGDAQRRANAPDGGLDPTGPGASPPAVDWAAEWPRIPAPQRACGVCMDTAAICAGNRLHPSLFQADSRRVALATYALRGEQPPWPKGVPAAGGPTCGELMRRACTDCAHAAPPPTP